MIGLGKKIGGGALLFCLLALSALAQQAEVQAYLERTEPLMGELRSNVRAFLDEVQPLREQKDMVGLKEVADRYITVWDGLLLKLSELEPPEVASAHYQALHSLFAAQQESNQVMSETLGEQIELLRRIGQMREEGAGEEEIQDFVTANPLDREAIAARSAKLKSAVQQADQTMETEHKKLEAIAEGQAEGES